MNEFNNIIIIRKSVILFIGGHQNREKENSKNKNKIIFSKIQMEGKYFSESVIKFRKNQCLR